MVSTLVSTVLPRLTGNRAATPAANDHMKTTSSPPSACWSDLRFCQFPPCKTSVAGRVEFVQVMVSSFAMSRPDYGVWSVRWFCVAI